MGGIATAPPGLAIPPGATVLDASNSYSNPNYNPNLPMSVTNYPSTSAPFLNPGQSNAWTPNPQQAAAGWNPGSSFPNPTPGYNDGSFEAWWAPGIQYAPGVYASGTYQPASAPTAPAIITPIVVPVTSNNVQVGATPSPTAVPGVPVVISASAPPTIVPTPAVPSGILVTNPAAIAATVPAAPIDVVPGIPAPSAIPDYTLQSQDSAGVVSDNVNQSTIALQGGLVSTPAVGTPSGVCALNSAGVMADTGSGLPCTDPISELENYSITIGGFTFNGLELAVGIIGLGILGYMMSRNDGRGRRY